MTPNEMPRSAGKHAQRTPAPLLWPTVAFMAGIWLAEQMGALSPRAGIWVASCGAILAIAAGVSTFFARRGGSTLYKVSAVLILAAAGSSGVLRHAAAVAKPANHVTRLLGKEPLLTRLVGDVVGTPYAAAGERRNPFIPFEPPGRTQVIVEARELRTISPAAPMCGRIRVSIAAEGLELSLGDRVQLTGRLYRPLPPRNPGEFDWARWNYLQGLEAGMAVEGAEHVLRVPSKPGWLLRAVAAARRQAHLLLLESYGDEPPDATGRLLDTLVLGQRTAADRELNEAFLRAGGMHFLAVSGFNVAVLAGATCWVVRGVLRRSARTAALVTAAVVVVYAAVAEPNAPIIRATILGVLVALSGLSGRRAMIWNGLAAGALGVLMLNPLELFRPGFQLSFVQVMAMIALVPRLARLHETAGMEQPRREANTWSEFLWHRLWREASGLAGLCTVAWLVATPLVLFHYGRLAPWGILGTMLLTVPVVLITWLGVLTIGVQALYAPAAALLAPLLHWLTGALLWLVNWFAGWVQPGLVECVSPPLWLVVGTYAVVLAGLAILDRVHAGDRLDEFRERRAARRRALAIWSGTFGLMAVAWIGWYGWPQRARTHYELHMLSVGNGNAVIVRTPGGEAVVLDAGTDRNLDAGETVARAARAMNVRRLAGCAISHANFDHCSGLPTLLDTLPSDVLLLSEYTASGQDTTPAVVEALEKRERARRVKRAAAGEVVCVGSTRLEVLWPPADVGDRAWKANDLSLVLRVHAGARTVLFTGDIEARAMRELLAADAAGTIQLASDVLVAPHHGSVTSETAAFYAAVKPELVLISSAQDRPKLTALLSGALGAQTRAVSTATAGAVSVFIQADGMLRVATALGAESGSGGER